MASAALSVLGYAGFGFLARCYALGIQKRNIMDSTLPACITNYRLYGSCPVCRRLW